MQKTHKNYLITGGSGFIGTHLTSMLMDEEVSNIYILDIKPPEVVHLKICYINCDIRFPINIKFNKKIDVCYHLAALAKEPGFEWDEYFETNYTGTTNVVKLCKSNDIRNIVFTSTMMVFRAGEKRYSENDLTSPDTAYGISKAMAELLLKEWAAEDEENSLSIVRPGVVFGKGEKGNYTRLYKALKKNTFFFVGRKNTVKSSIYVKDLVRFLVHITNDKNKNSIFNFVYPYQLTIEEICGTFLYVFRWKRFIPVVPFKLALLFSYAFELLSFFGIKTGVHHRRIEKLFHSTNVSSELVFQNGFKLQYNLKEALEDWKKDCAPSDIY